MEQIEMVVFDMAGTTVNENNVVYKTVQKCIVDAGFKVSLDMVLEHGAGKEKRKAIADVLRNLNGDDPNEEMVNAIFKTFKGALVDAYQELKVTSYQGVEDLFVYLKSKNIKVVLNTGYDQRTAQGLLDSLGWQVGHEIDGLITADDVETGRPSAEMITLAMNRFSIKDSSKVLKAGDSIIDIEEGKNAHCGITVGVLTGAQTREQLQTADPTIILDSLAQLREVL